jgi:hypothetical protein
VFEIISLRNNDANAEIMLYEYVYKGSIEPKKTLLTRMNNCPNICNMGLQLADDKVTAFYIATENINDNPIQFMSRGYTFSETKQMHPDTYKYFAKGVFTNSYGKIQAPELRVVLEVETKRKESASIDDKNIDFLTELRVTPAYQYDVFLEHPESHVNRATVAQKIGRYSDRGLSYTMLTYDTHGTENKGFRKDEKLAREGKK